MGGRALKVVYTRRYEREEYLKLQDEIMELLLATFDDVAVPLYYRNKESFGDMDIICTWPTNIEESERGSWMRNYINETFQPGEIFHNDRSWSFNVEEIQVDVIMCEPNNFDAMCHYLSYNDLGNLMGRLAHGLGLKYGQDGLVYDHYFKDAKVGRITVSQDYPRIFEFLGLDYKRWERGFDTLEEVFDFVIGSKYFNYNKFQLHELNKINRERNLKRVSYMKFLDYIEQYQDKQYQFPPKEESVQNADKFFPEFPYKLETRRMEYEKTKDLYIQAKFNGGEIMRRFGIQGKEISELMSKFKERIIESRAIMGGLIYGPPYNEEEFKTYVLETSLDNIYHHFQIFLDDIRRNQP